MLLKVFRHFFMETLGLKFEFNRLNRFYRPLKVESNLKRVVTEGFAKIH